MDFNIACLSLDMLYIACEFNLDDWTIGFVVLLKWLSVDENLTVNQFHAWTLRNVNCSAVVSDTATNSANNCAGEVVGDFHKNLFL